MEAKLKKLAALVEKNLARYISDKNEYPPIIYKAAKYSLFAGGKRLRPILTLLSAKACGFSYADVMPAACAMEMIHTYSLIHDDLPAMDDDDFRRGKPTSHKKFGEAIAILAGDALLTKAFESILACARNKKIKPVNVIKAAVEISQGAGMQGMIGGQVLDITSEGKKISIDSLNYLHKCKTGALIRASAVSGAMLAGADNRTISLFRQYGEKIGLAFQIIDDMLDVTGDEKKMGKKLRKDSGAKKATYPAIYGLERSAAKARKLTLEACGILGKINGDTRDLKDLALFFTKRES